SRPDQPESGQRVPEDIQQQHSSITVLRTGGRDHHRQQHPSRLDEDMACAAVDVFMGIVAVDPPFAVVLTA
ncbi:MAG TPA: hypothetical protein VGC99_15240, partial [Candidatus Tectomicrobia bacterium]